jgi:putative transcriptional regulator
MTSTRKVRWADARRGKGTRGGLRVIYFYFEQDGQIWFLTMYGKDEAADLTSKEKRALKAAIEEEKRQRVRRRTSRRT